MGVVKVVQNSERPLPGSTRLLAVPGRMLGVPDVTERIGFAPAVTDLPVQVEGALIAGGRFAMVAEVMMGVTEAVPDPGLHVGRATELGVQAESPPAVAEGLPVVPEVGVEPADAVQGDRLALPVAGGGQMMGQEFRLALDEIGKTLL